MAGYDVVVLGAGHAGCEAALACARMGLNTAAITLNLDSIALMACNPAIGGTSKGQLVREIDALGGEMGLAADDEFIQMRMLNTGKGPAVYSPRAQMDKRRYHERMKRALEAEEKLTLIQGECAAIETEHGRISAIRLSGGVKSEGERIECRAVVVATGVYLKSRILIGDRVWEQGPSGLARAEGLSASLRELGGSKPARRRACLGGRLTLTKWKYRMGTAQQGRFRSCTIWTAACSGRATLPIQTRLRIR